MRLVVLVAALAACKSKRIDEVMPEPPPAPDAAVVAPAEDAARPWPELEGYIRVTPERVIALPAKPDIPRFALGGPIVIGELAIVSSSQFGFVAANWRQGTIAWTKNAGTQVAPPVRVGDDIVLIGDCAKPPVVGDRELLVGCLRVVTPAGAEENYIAIRGKKPVEPFLAERGDQATSRIDDRTVKWQRGEAAIAIDIVTGVARPADPTPAPLAVEYKGKRWAITQVEGRVVAYKAGTKKIDWQTRYPYTRVLGLVHTEDNPILRIANANQDVPYIDLIDIDATGSLHAQVAKPTPGIDVLASAVSPAGDAALAVRVDSSLRRDVVAGYAANARHVWVYPLPEHQRADPVGIAISEGADAVVVFHDGDTLTVLPELSATPTTRDASSGSLKKPTP